MSLFIRILPIVSAVFITACFTANSQNCTPYPVQFPDSVCQGQTVQGFNPNPASLQFTWDVCAGDFFRTASFASSSHLPAGNFFGIKTVRTEGKFHGFAVQFNSSTLFRMDFDTSLNSPPTVTNLANPGNALASPAGFDLEQDGSTWFGFCNNRSGNSVVRLKFASGLTNSPTASTISVPGLGNSNGIDVFKDGERFYAFTFSFSTRRLHILDFGNSLDNEPTLLPDLNIGAITAYSVSAVSDCSGKYLFVADNAGRVTKVSFGNSFANPTPTQFSIALSPGFSGGAFSLGTYEDGGRKLVLVGGGTSGGFGLLNFGSTYQTNAPAVSTLISGQAINVTGLSPVQSVGGGGSLVMGLLINGSLARLNLGGGSCAQIPMVSSQHPPSFLASSSGKHFINYWVRNPDGQLIQFGDSIFVKGITTDQPVPTVQVVADEQCPSRQTRFFPQVSPAGNYSFLWTFPGGTTSTATNPSFQFPGQGSFPIRVFIRPANGCGSFTISQEVRIYPNPSVSITSDFSVPPQICTRDSIVFNDGSTPQNQIRRWKWDFGGGQIYFTQNPKAFFNLNQAGQTIQVSLKASDSSGCGTPVSKPVTPSAGPDLQFGLAKICFGETSEISNSTPSPANVSFLWNFGDPNSGAANTSTSNSALLTHTFSDTGIFRVEVRGITANGCTSRVSRDVRILPLPEPDFSFPSVLFPGNEVLFSNQSRARYQTITAREWNFGDPASGSQNTSTTVNPVHVYNLPGSYPVQLKVTTDQNCMNSKTRNVSVFEPCPVVSFSKSPSPSGDFDTLTIQNQTTLVRETQIDFCAGDLELTPVLQSQQTGSQPISSASQVVPVKEGENWIGFIPAPNSLNATCFFKATIGNSLNNDISNFSSSLGTLQNRFPNPSFIRFFKEDSIWYAFACNNDAKLWRIRFGTSLDNNSPSVSEVILPNGTLATPAGAQFVQDKDSTYLFIVNNNNQTQNNVVRLRFSGSVANDPEVFVLNNPLVLQNSNGFVNLTFGRTCGNWHALLLATSQLYRLDFGNSLQNIPSAASLTSEITAGLGSANAFNNLRGVSLLQDLGRWYALINSNTGGLIRVRFGNGLGQAPDQVSPLGNFGITGIVGAFHFVQEKSEVFGMTINNAGTVYKIKFPNLCPTDQPFFTQTTPGSVTTRYRSPGRYFITLTSFSPFGSVSQRVDSVRIENTSIQLSCKTTLLNHPDKICFDYNLTPSVSGGNFQNGEWDFCTGDFNFPPSLLAQPVASTVANGGGIQVVESGGNYYAFLANASGLWRLNLGNQPDGVPGQPVSVMLPNGGTNFSLLSDFKIFREGDNWFGLLIYFNGEGMLRLNFGSDITNNVPGFAILNLPGFLSRPRGIDLFEDGANKYAAIVNQTSGSLSLLNFGNTYRNIPFATAFDVPSAVNLYKISMIRDCNLWHAFVSDQAQDSIYQLTFNRGLGEAPSRRMLVMTDGVGLKAVKDGNSFYLFATKVQTGMNNLYKFSFGNSLSNTPGVDSLGNFPVTTVLTGLQRVNAFHLYRNAKSNYFLFGLGFDNGQLYRIRFQNPCSADFPIAQGDTVPNQAYRADGKFYFTWQGYDKEGNLVSAFDSVNVQNLVDADFTIPGNRCKGEPIQFNDASITGNFTSITNWNWDFDDSLSTVDTSVLANPVHLYTKAGIYRVRLRVREQGGCINEIVRSVVVADKPRPNFTTGTGNTLCTNDSISFTDASVTVNDPIVERVWEVRQNGNLIATSTRINPKFLFTQTGNYEVTLRIKGESQCDSSVTRIVPVAAVGSRVSFVHEPACLGEPVTFSPTINGPAADSIRWFVDAAPFQVAGNFVHTFNTTNVFSVRLTVYNGECANTFNRIVRVNTRPDFSIAVQAPLNCEGLPVNFSTSLNTSETVFYDWNFGDGTTDTLKNPVKIFNAPGNYPVVLKITTENGCVGADTVSYLAKRAPKALFTFDKACKDEPVTFLNQSTANGIPGGIISYFWEFGTSDLQTSTQQDPPPVFYNEPPGVKVVKLTVRTAEDCPNTYTLNMPIGPKLAANYRKETGCIGTPFRFYDMTAAGSDSIRSWNWSIGGLTYNTRNPVVEFDLKGTYDVRLKVTSKSGCVDEVVRTDDFTVLDAATADFSISSTFSPPTYRVVFSQIPAVNDSYSYEWDFGDSTSSTSGNPPPHFYKKEDTYIVTLKATRTGTICSTVVQKPVNVIINPVQGLKVRRITLARGNEQIRMAAEVENQSNIALRSFDLVAKIGSLVATKETWSGILLPGGVTTYEFTSDVLFRNSQKIPFICLTAQLSDPSKETSPADNSLCSSLDSVPSLTGLFPNPAGKTATVEFNLTNSDPYEIRVINCIGQEVERYTNDSPLPGPYRRILNVSAFPDGMYYVWFRSGDVVENRKLLIRKE